MNQNIRQISSSRTDWENSKYTCEQFLNLKNLESSQSTWLRSDVLNPPEFVSDFLVTNKSWFYLSNCLQSYIGVRWWCIVITLLWVIKYLRAIVLQNAQLHLMHYHYLCTTIDDLCVRLLSVWSYWKPQVNVLISNKNLCAF